MLVSASSLLTGALSYTIAISWNKATYETLSKFTGEGKFTEVLHAIIITLSVIVIFILLNALFLVINPDSKLAQLNLPLPNKDSNFKYKNNKNKDKDI